MDLDDAGWKFLIESQDLLKVEGFSSDLYLFREKVAPLDGGAMLDGVLKPAQSD